MSTADLFGGSVMLVKSTLRLTICLDRSAVRTAHVRTHGSMHKQAVLASPGMLVERVRGLTGAADDELCLS
jgi:hypothetical protein